MVIVQCHVLVSWSRTDAAAAALFLSPLTMTDWLCSHWQTVKVDNISDPLSLTLRSVVVVITVSSS